MRSSARAAGRVRRRDRARWAAVAATALLALATRLPTTRAGGCAHMNDCNGHGTCDEASRICNCFEGWGAPTDIAPYKAPDCSMRVCPSDRAWVDIPSASNKAHAPAECSNMGLCDRSSGRCRCFAGFEGDACQRSSCPNGCSGHGKCVSLAQMASEPNAMPVRRALTYGGLESTTTWDENKIFGCVCDSAWAVGLKSGEVQEPSWFGPDCSLRHCPSGDDPGTSGTGVGYDETNCQYFLDNGATWMGGLLSGAPNYASPTTGIDPTLVAGLDYGASGNKCHVDCSNRGLCDYSSGLCRCFRGYYGEACDRVDVLAKGEA